MTENIDYVQTDYDFCHSFRLRLRQQDQLVQTRFELFGISFVLCDCFYVFCSYFKSGPGLVIAL